MLRPGFAKIGAVKERARGVTGAELLVSMASAQLAGQDFLVGLDRHRMDMAGQVLEPAAAPASTTADGIAKRFTGEHLAVIETGIGQINTTMVDLLPPVRCRSLLRAATIDGDATDVEVYGRTKVKATQATSPRKWLVVHIESRLRSVAERTSSTQLRCKSNKASTYRDLDVSLSASGCEKRRNFGLHTQQYSPTRAPPNSPFAEISAPLALRQVTTRPHPDPLPPPSSSSSS